MYVKTMIGSSINEKKIRESNGSKELNYLTFLFFFIFSLKIWSKYNLKEHGNSIQMPCK